MSALDLLYARRRRVSLQQSAQLEQYAFHGTSKANLRAIRAVGLLPKVGDNTVDAEGKDVEAKVCLATDQETAQEYANQHDDGVVLKVDLDHPRVASASQKSDAFTRDALTVNQRIPPEAIKVLKPAEARGLTIARLSHGYARDLKLKTEVAEPNGMPAPSEIAKEYGFTQDSEQTHGDLGRVVRYFHPSGDRLIVTSRDNLEKPINQHAAASERLKGVSGNWLTRWEYHTMDGTKSTGYDVWGLENHLKRIHGEQTA